MHFRQCLGCAILFYIILFQSVLGKEVSQTETHSFLLSKGGEVTLLGDEGDIFIKSWNKEEVLLKMTKRVWAKSQRRAERLLDDLEVEIVNSGDKLTIREMNRHEQEGFNLFDVFDSDFWSDKKWRSGVIDFELVVPNDIGLKIFCDEGDVDVEKIQGSLHVDVDEGDIRVQQVTSKKIQIRVDEGDVRLVKIEAADAGIIKIDTDEGQIRVDDSLVDELDLRTDEGDIFIRNCQVKRFGMFADEGDLVAEFLPVQNGRYHMGTDEGDIRITVPEEANIDVKLRAEEGRIESDFNIKIWRRDEQEQMEGTIGESRGLLKAYSSEGDIVIKEMLEKVID